MKAMTPPSEGELVTVAMPAPGVSRQRSPGGLLSVLVEGNEALVRVYVVSRGANAFATTADGITELRELWVTAHLEAARWYREICAGELTATDPAAIM